MNSSPFSLETTFLPADASEDKIDLELSGWDVTGLLKEMELVHVFKQRMSSPPAGSGDMAWPAVEGEQLQFGWFFLRPASKGKDQKKLCIRKQALSDKNNGRRHEAPLCGGYCLFYFHKQAQLAWEKNAHRAKLRLSLNLQRFIRHQPSKNSPLFAYKPRLKRRREDRSHHEAEWAFDGEDNWIPDTELWRKLTKDSRHLPDYLKVIADEMESNLKRACDFQNKLEGVDFLGWHRSGENYSLSTVETLWEFPSDNPMVDVWEIGQKLLHLKRAHGTANLNDVGRTKAARIADSPCFVIPLAENVSLRLYAKTNRRIRFEVIHSNLGKLREALRKEAGIHGEELSWDEIPLLMTTLRERAAELMNQTMAELRKGKDCPLKARSIIHLLSEITAAIPQILSPADRFERIQNLLVWLCFQKGFRGSSKRGPYAVALERLVKRGVLKFVRARQFYVLAPEYMDAADNLKSVTGEPLLSIFGMDWGGYTISEKGELVRLREG